MVFLWIICSSLNQKNSDCFLYIKRCVYLKAIMENLWFSLGLLCLCTCVWKLYELYWTGHVRKKIWVNSPRRIKILTIIFIFFHIGHIYIFLDLCLDSTLIASPNQRKQTVHYIMHKFLKPLPPSNFFTFVFFTTVPFS